MTTQQPEPGRERIIADLKTAVAEWPRLTEAEKEQMRASVARRVGRVL
jgi:hypothetical protein